MEKWKMWSRGRCISIPNSKLLFWVKVRFSFRTNIIQRKVSLSYRLVSILSTNCFLFSHINEIHLWKLLCLQLQIWVALGICLLFCQAETLCTGFCSTPLATWCSSFWHIFCTSSGGPHDSLLPYILYHAAISVRNPSRPWVMFFLCISNR